MTRTQSSSWCLPGAFGSADSDSVQPSEGLMPPPEPPLQPKEDAVLFPSLAEETPHKVATERQRKRL